MAMRRLARVQRYLASHLAWRLLAVFVAAALLPLALSDWLATSAIADLSEKLYDGRRAESTRDVSRQVFDRLVLAKTLLGGLAEASGTGVMPSRPAMAFAAVHCDAPAARATPTASQEAPLVALDWAWDAASPAAGAPPLAAVEMRVLPGATGRPAQLLMAARASSGTRCLAEIDREWLWAPVRDSSDDAAWRVRVDNGPLLLAGTWPALEGDAEARPDRFAAHLFLMSEFGAANWTFEQQTPHASIRWHGKPLITWLATVALATLLGIALLGSWTLRRALEPLRQLTQGSRRLAAGVAPTRVDIRRHDELGELATSFNDMAAQLEARIAALRGLAAIDAGILAGAPMAWLAHQVLERLAALSPTVVGEIVWRDSGGQFWRLRGNATHALDMLAVDAAAADAFGQLRDGRHAPDALGGLPFAAPPGTDAVELLVVRDGRRNQAVIALSLPAAAAAIELPPCAELRDRLSVAMVARAREAELEHRAGHDLLTGLRNTYGLQQALDVPLSRDEPMAILFIDLDHFKDVNDCHGHAIGDRLLQMAARRLERLAPPGGVVSRNGGDEFLLAVPALDADGACELASRIVAAFAQPFVVSTMELACGASIGIALSPQHGLDRSELLRCADIALYQSKAAGRGRFTLFVPAFDVAVREKNDLLAGLARALTRSELVVHYQPRLDATTRRITSAEALVRWQHPERGLLLPGAFIELAESSGLIDALGACVLDIAIGQFAAWRLAGLAVERISVNASPRQFASGTLARDIQALLQRHAMPGSALELEVTESLLVGDMASARSQLDALRALGVRIAMDDFGTGYSSMALLRDLPIDVMKVDRAFVSDLATDPNAVAIVRTIVTLARALELSIVAEGIETEAQAALLGALGCDEFQGFLFAHGLPAPDFAALVAAAPFARMPAAASTGDTPGMALDGVALTP
jgi:diguanylate cyclase (GGDEF)-like protein